MELTIATEARERGRWALLLNGSLDLQSRDALLEAARVVIRTNSSTGLILNLSDVTFIDSAGIGSLVELAGNADDADREFVLEEPSARVRRILEITGLWNTWTVESAPEL